MADTPLMVFVRRILATVLLVSLALGVVSTDPALAGIVVYSESLTVAGEPTPEERLEITLQWDRLLTALPSSRLCAAPVTVVVVDSAEVAWGGGISGIAAFYRVSEKTLYIEHGKVRAEHLIHEFAHHLDFSCGFGTSELGTAFLDAQGFTADHEWARGSRWQDVPAEHFAEAVVGYLDIDSVDLPVTPEAFATVARFATHGTSEGPERPHTQRTLANLF